MSLKIKFISYMIKWLDNCKKNPGIRIFINLHMLSHYYLNY